MSQCYFASTFYSTAYLFRIISFRFLSCILYYVACAFVICLIKYLLTYFVVLLGQLVTRAHYSTVSVRFSELSSETGCVVRTVL